MADTTSVLPASPGGAARAPQPPNLLQRFLDQFEPSLGPLEADYRQNFLLADVGQALVANAIGMGGLVVFAYFDYRFLGWGAEFFRLLALRVGLFALALLMHRLLGRTTAPSRADRLILVSEAVTAAAAIFVNLSRPPTYWQSPLVDMLIILSFYTLIPQPLLNRVLAGFGFSLASAAVLVFTKIGIPPLTLLIALVSLLLANALGLVVSIRIFNYRRNQYKALLDQRAAQAALEWLATTDSLTGVLNRRSFLHAAEQEMTRYLRHGRVFSILIIDLDRFKDINDNYGHQAGDLALKSFSELVAAVGRSADTFGRLGGEEFGLLMPETNLAAARLAAERLRARCQALDLSAEGDHLPLTLSGGLVQVMANDPNLDSLMRRADQALYRAKQAGRNRIEVSA